MSQEKNLIIFTHGGGRFANQLFSYAHLIAFLVENNYKYDLINLAFWPYAHLLENTSNNLACTFPTTHSQWQILQQTRGFLQIFPSKVYSGTKMRNGIVSLLYRYSFFNSDVQSIIANDISELIRQKNNSDTFDLNDADDIDLLNLSKVTFLAGWGVRSWTLVEKHQKIIRECLLPNIIYINTAKNFIQELRGKYDYLIGLLIRQGDYKLMLEGKYFFETQQYIDWIRQAQEVFGLSSKVGFVIASDQPQDFDKFEHLSVNFATGAAIGKGHFLENMMELSMCDFIMTPPSTFSVWAAFLGNIPILPLYLPLQEIAEQDILDNHIFDSICHPYLSDFVK